MSSLAIVESPPRLEPEIPVTLPEGRIARFVSKARDLRQGIGIGPNLSLLGQLRGLGPGAWLGGFLGSILLLNRFVSPLITSLAMTTLIAPFSALVLIMLGEFDFNKLTTMVTNNAGLVLATAGSVVAALFIQNVLKMALFLKSFASDSHKQYRTYAMASVFAPITTSAIWYGFTKVGYFVASKTIVLGVLAIFASGAVGDALGSVDPSNVTTAELATVVSVMSDGLRLGLGIIICIHLWFVYLSYGLVHRTLNSLFDLIAKRIVEDKWHRVVADWVKGHKKTVFIIPLIAACLVWARSEDVENQLRVTCVNGVTYATESGVAYRLTNRDGSSHCLSSATTSMVAIGRPYSVGDSYRREILVHQAGGYGGGELRNYTDDYGNRRTQRTEVYRKDVTAAHDVRYWLELPEGLPNGVAVPTS